MEPETLLRQAKRALQQNRRVARENRTIDFRLCHPAEMYCSRPALQLPLTAFALAAAALPAWAAGWKVHDTARPEPPVVTPPAQKLPAPAPPGALILFDGNDLSNWTAEEGGAPEWRLRDGAMEVKPGAGLIRTKRSFGDLQLHLEWAAPLPAEGAGQGRGNSGLHLMGLYEVQVLDSYKNRTYADGQAAAIYGQYPPLVNACRPPGEWQSYDIVFRAPRFGAGGKLLKPARVTVVHNGILVQDNVQVMGPTTWLQRQPYTAHAARLPFTLQEHGNPVRFRNIWVREIGSTPPPAPSNSPVRARTTLSARELERLAGTYVMEGGRRPDLVKLLVRRGRLMMALPRRTDLVELVPLSRTEFVPPHTDARLRFKRGAGSRPAEFEFIVGGAAAFTARRRR